jgi:hypothetical protein
MIVSELWGALRVLSLKEAFYNLFLLLLLLFVLFFEIVSHYVAQAGLKLVTLLP